MYTNSQISMINNLYSVATDEELEDSYFQINKKEQFDEREVIENVIIDNIKERVSKRVLKQRVMEPEYYAGA